MAASIEKAYSSRLLYNKIDPSFSTIEKIAKEMGCSFAELFAHAVEIKEIHLRDISLMEKLTLIEMLPKEEK